MATTYDLTQANNLNPDYTSDPTAASASLAQLQAELAQVQANPNDPNYAYYIATLTPAIQEQQNIVNYLGAQTATTNASSQATYIGQMLNTISSNQAGNSNLMNTGDMNALAQYASQNGDPTVTLQMQVGPNKVPVSMKLSQAWQMAASGKIQAYVVADAMNNSGVTGKYVSTLQSTLNSANKNLAGDNSTVLNGLTFAQPNYSGANGTIATTFAGLKQSELNPALQDIYATAYNNKMGTMDQLINAGMGSSGVATKAKGNIDSQALNKSFSEIGNFNNAQAQAKTDLANQQEQQQAQYQKTLDSAKSQDLGSLLAGSANNFGASFNNNTQAQTQTALNNAQNQLAQTQANANNQGSFLSGLGSLAGTIGGGLLAGPGGAAAGGSLGGLI